MATSPSEAGPPPSASSGLWSLDIPSSPGSQDSALPRNQARQGGVGSQPGQALDTEEDGSVRAEGNSTHRRGHAVRGTDRGTGGGAQGDPVPSNPTEVKGLSTSKPSVDEGLPQKGDRGPALSASEGPCKDTGASQRAPLPESKGETSGHKKEVPLIAEPAASEVGSREWWGGVGVSCPSGTLLAAGAEWSPGASVSFCHYDFGFGSSVSSRGPMVLQPRQPSRRRRTGRQQETTPRNRSRPL